MNLTNGNFTQYANNTLNLTSTNACHSEPVDSRFLSMIFEGVVAVVIGILGLIGNVASVIALSKKHFKQPIHKLILVMAIVDSCFIIIALPILLIRGHQLYLIPIFQQHMTSIINTIFPASKFFMAFSIYIRMSIAFEQFLGIAFSVYVVTRSKRVTLILYLLPCIVLSSTYTFVNVVFKSKMRIRPTSNGTEENTEYLPYTNEILAWGNIIITTIVPICILLMCFIGCTISLYTQKLKRAVLLPSLTKKQLNSPAFQVFWTISAMLLFFAVCHSGRIVMTVYHASVIENRRKCFVGGQPTPNPKWLYYASIISNLLIFINCSSNYIFYCLMGSKVKNEMRKIFTSANNLNRVRQCSVELNVPARSEGAEPNTSPEVVLNAVLKHMSNAHRRRGARRNSSRTLSLSYLFSEVRRMSLKMFSRQSSRGERANGNIEMAEIPCPNMNRHPDHLRSNGTATNNKKMDKHKTRRRSSL